MALSIVRQPFLSNANVPSSKVLAVGSQAVYELNESDLTGKDNYRVEVQIEEAVGTDVYINDLFYVPDSKGTVKIDLGEVFTYLIEKVVEPTPGVGGNIYRYEWYFTPRFRAIYGSTTEAFVDGDNTLCIKGKVQLGGFGGITDSGANYILYLLYLDNTDDQTVLTQFKPEGRIWAGSNATVQGFKKTLYTIIDAADLTSRVPITDMRYRLKYYDINKTFIAEKPDSNIAIPIFQDYVSELRVIINANELVTYPNAAYISVQVERTTPSAAFLSPEYFLKIYPMCENPIYLTWRNSLGVMDFWLFSFNQDVEEVAEVGETIKPPHIDFSGINQQYNNYNQRALQRKVDITSQYITLVADGLTPEEVRALHEIKTSQQVAIQLKKNPADDQTEVAVIVEDIYSTNYRTRDKLNAFSVKVRLPDNFNVFDLINYDLETASP